MEKEKSVIHAHPVKATEEKKLEITPGIIHSCCGKCRQKDQLLIKPCNKNIEKGADIHPDHEATTSQTTYY